MYFYLYLFDTFVLVFVSKCVLVFVFQSLLKAKPPITEDDFKEDFQRQVRPWSLQHNPVKIMMMMMTMKIMRMMIIMMMMMVMMMPIRGKNAFLSNCHFSEPEAVLGALVTTISFL